MKLNLIILVFSLTLISYKKKVENKPEKIIQQENIEIDKETKSEIDIIVALKFINEYSEFCNKQFKKQTTITSKSFIEKNEFLSDSFKKKYKELIETAEKEDPELGLDFDPIFDAQDFPENGFELSSVEKSGYLIVKGKGSEWANFTVKLKVINFENKWLVDGAGVINIPENLREKR